MARSAKAHAMMLHPDKAGEIVGFYDGDKYMGFLIIKKTWLWAKKFPLAMRTPTSLVMMRYRF